MHICAGVEGAIVKKLENTPIRLLILSPPLSPACLQVLSTSSTSSFSLLFGLLSYVSRLVFASAGLSSASRRSVMPPR